MLQGIVYHLLDAVRGLGGTRDGIKFNGNHLSVLSNLLAAELALEFLGCDLAAQTRRFRLVVEVGADNGVAIRCNGKVTANGTPKSIALHGYDADLPVDDKKWQRAVIGGITVLVQEERCGAMLLEELRGIVLVYIGNASRPKDIDAFLVLLVALLERMEVEDRSREQGGHHDD